MSVINLWLHVLVHNGRVADALQVAKNHKYFIYRITNLKAGTYGIVLRDDNKHIGKATFVKVD